MAKYCRCGCHGDAHLLEGGDGTRGGPFECLLDAVHNHDEAEDEAEDK